MVRPQEMLGASQDGLSYLRSPQDYPGRAVNSQTLKQGDCVSHKRPPQGKTGPQGGVGRPHNGICRPHVLKGTLRQAQGRRGETANNAGCPPMRHLPTQKSPGLSWTGCNASGFGSGCLCLSYKAPTSKHGATVWCGWAAGTQGDTETGS